MKKRCGFCGGTIPSFIMVEGKIRNLQNRKFCLQCSPFGLHNTRKIPPVNRKKNKQGVEIRNCVRCKSKIDAHNGYVRKSRGGRQFASYCKICFNEITQIRWHKRKIYYIKKLGGKCVECGKEGLHPVLYDFHHVRDKDTKWMDLKKRTSGKMEKELKKCILLCCGCHRLKHMRPDLWERAINNS